MNLFKSIKVRSHDAWIGFAGAIVGAFITGIFGLIIANSSAQPTVSEKINHDAYTGIQSLIHQPSIDKKLSQVDKLLILVETDQNVMILRKLETFKRDFGAEIIKIKQEESELQELEKERLALAEKELLAKDEKLREKLAAEEREAKRIAEARLAAIEAERAVAKAESEKKIRLLAEQKKSEEEKRLARMEAAQKLIYNERKCLNKSCSEWIIP